MPHGALLIAFTEAVLSHDESKLVSHRRAIYETLGAEALVDAAGAVASFNGVVKVADGTGLEVDEQRQATAAALSQQLGLHARDRTA